MHLELEKALRMLERLNERSRLWAVLVIASDQLKPDQISEMLEITPTDALAKGSELLGNRSTARKCLAEKNYWSLSSREQVKSSSMSDHINWLVEKLYGKSPTIRFLQQTDAYFNINAHLSAGPRDVAIELDVDLLQRLASLRIPVTYHIRYLNSQSPY